MHVLACPRLISTIDQLIDLAINATRNTWNHLLSWKLEHSAGPSRNRGVNRVPTHSSGPAVVRLK